MGVIGTAVGRAARAVVLIVLLVTLAGCAAQGPRTPVVPAGPSGRHLQPTPTPTAGPTPTAVPPARPDPIAVPNLPIGGDSDYVDRTQSQQCVDLHWSAKASGPAALRDGATVTITAFAYDHYVFGLTRSGCESRGPTCLGYTFSATSGRPACSLAVRTRWPLVTTLDDRRLAAGGVLSCPATLGTKGCRRLANAIGDRWTTVSVSTPHRRTPARS